MIQWGDETGLSNQADYGRSFAPEGQTPVIRRTARRDTTSMISSITNRGQARFMIDEDALNADLFLAFLKRLIEAAERKVFLPAYAPEHNPDEFLDDDVKQATVRRPAAKGKDAPKASMRSYMGGLQRQPNKVRSFFNTSRTCYAA